MSVLSQKDRFATDRRVEGAPRNGAFAGFDRPEDVELPEKMFSRAGAGIA
jgi:hypothetical protein